MSDAWKGNYHCKFAGTTGHGKNRRIMCCYSEGYCIWNLYHDARYDVSGRLPWKIPFHTFGYFHQPKNECLNPEAQEPDVGDGTHTNFGLIEDEDQWYRHMLLMEGFIEDYEEEVWAAGVRSMELKAYDAWARTF